MRRDFLTDKYAFIFVFWQKVHKNAVDLSKYIYGDANPISLYLSLYVRFMAVYCIYVV
jgi:hypothetical protein